jgi:hypothetical protein
VWVTLESGGEGVPVEVGLWRVDGGKPQRMSSTGIEREKQLEDLIEHDPAILGYPLLIIGRQVATRSGGIIDLLGVDEEGNLHVLELKRARTPREQQLHHRHPGQGVPARRLTSTRWSRP